MTHVENGWVWLAYRGGAPGPRWPTLGVGRPSVLLKWPRGAVSCHICYWRSGSSTSESYIFCVKYFVLFCFFKILFTYSWAHTHRGRDIGRGRGRLPVGNPIQDSIPGTWDHDLSRRQTLNHWATQVPPNLQCYQLFDFASLSIHILTGFSSRLLDFNV